MSLDHMWVAHESEHLASMLRQQKPDWPAINELAIVIARSVAHAANGTLSVPKPSAATESVQAHAQAAAQRASEQASTGVAPPAAQQSPPPPPAAAPAPSAPCGPCADRMIELARLDLAASAVRIATLALGARVVYLPVQGT